MKHIEKIWNGYVAAVYPHDIPDTQLHETKQAFYAGALALFKELGRGDRSDGETLKFCEEVEAELSAYHKLRVEFMNKPGHAG